MGSCSSNQEGRIVLVNLQTEKLFGYGREELLGRRSRFWSRNDCGEGTAGTAPDSWATRKSRPMGAGLELFGLRKDGTEFPIEISLSPIHAGEGSLVCTAIRDITDRKRIEERLRRLLDSAPDAMVIAGNDGRIVLVNTQTEKLFGYKREELLGQPVEVLFRSDSGTTTGRIAATTWSIRKRGRWEPATNSTV